MAFRGIVLLLFAAQAFLRVGRRGTSNVSALLPSAVQATGAVDLLPSAVQGIVRGDAVFFRAPQCHFLRAAVIDESQRAPA